MLNFARPINFFIIQTYDIGVNFRLCKTTTLFDIHLFETFEFCHFEENKRREILMIQVC